MSVELSAIAGGGLNPRGAWSAASVFYRVLDQVTHDNDLYRCILAHTSAAGSEPGELGGASYWVREVNNITVNQQAALDAATTLDGTHPVAATTDARFPTTDEKAALPGTSGTAVSGSNKLVDNADTRLTNSRTPTAHQLDTATYHTVSGLTTRDVLQATGATTFGFAELDGDKLDIDWNPSYSTPATVTETDDVDDLSSHLKGVDNLFGTLRATMEPGGRLWVPPAYMQTTGDAASALTSANTKIAVAFTPEVDFDPNGMGLSWYLTATTAAGNVTIGIYDDSTALEPDGRWNGNQTNVAPTMSANNAPSPYVIAATDKFGNATATLSLGPDAYRLMDKSLTTANSVKLATIAYCDNAAAVDKGAGKVGIAITGLGTITAGTVIKFAGTTNYSATTYTVDATSSANEVVFTGTYIAEGITSSAYVRIAPCTSHPVYVTLDNGLGQTAIINKFRLYAYDNASATTRSFLKTLTFWASNLASPAAQTDGDWAQLTGATTWTAETDPGQAKAREYYVSNGTAYRWYRWAITSTNTGLSEYAALADIYLYAAQSMPAPGSLLHSYGDHDTTGASADTWIRKALDSYQFQREKRYWLVLTGSAALNVSASLRHVNTANGSEFPDKCVCKISSDGGTTWTQATQNSKPAMLNFILGSTANHTPALIYGARQGGQYVYCPGDGIKTIPAAGVWLNCEALTALTLYNAYIYDNTGTLTLEASATARVLTEGIQTKSGATTHRFLGTMKAVNLVSTYQGPINVKDRRLVRNEHHVLIKEFGKSNPYTSAATYLSLLANGGQYYVRANGNNDWLVDCLGGDCFLSFGYAYCDYVSSSFMIDNELQDIAYAQPGNGGNAGGWDNDLIFLSRRLVEGYHTIVPIHLLPYSATADSTVYYLYTTPAADNVWAVAELSGTIKC